MIQEYKRWKADDELMQIVTIIGSGWTVSNMAILPSDRYHLKGDSP